MYDFRIKKDIKLIIYLLKISYLIFFGGLTTDFDSVGGFWGSSFVAIVYVLLNILVSYEYHTNIEQVGKNELRRLYAFYVSPSGLSL